MQFSNTVFNALLPCSVLYELRAVLAKVEAQNPERL
jgi:hypothetical protein